VDSNDDEIDERRSEFKLIGEFEGEIEDVFAESEEVDIDVEEDNRRRWRNGRPVDDSTVGALWLLLLTLDDALTIDGDDCSSVCMSDKDGDDGGEGELMSESDSYFCVDDGMVDDEELHSMEIDESGSWFEEDDDVEDRRLRFLECREERDRTAIIGWWG
jgi:hypothetical protein